MKRLLTLFVALFMVSLGGDNHAQQRKRHRSATVKKTHIKKRSSRAKAQPQALPLASSEYDELALAP